MEICRTPAKIAAVIGTVLLCLAAAVSAQENTITSGQAAFLTYRCDFSAETYSAQIHASLTGSDGLALPQDQYTFNITTASGEQVAPERVTISLAERDALRMVIVLDTTDTVPVNEIVRAISTRLVPQLQVEDAVALVTFSNTVSPTTAFYFDKNRLINEHMIDLRTQSGDNRLYDAILQALAEMEFNQNVRQTVLVLTDSARRSTLQASSDDILARARAANAQIYSIGFYTRDIPDEQELFTLSSATQGYSWIYNQRQNTRATIEEAVSDRLDDLVQSLNSEILMTVDMRGLAGVADQQILFNIVVETANNSTLTGQITCPVEVLTHSIGFIGGTDDINTTTPVDIAVTVDSPLGEDETNIVFWVNNEPIQDSDSAVFNFNTPTMSPGEYTIGAQLRDHNGDILATTPGTLKIFAQQVLQFNVTGGALTALTAPVTFEVTTDPTLELPDIHFVISALSTPNLSYPLGQGTAPVQNGRATLTVANMQAEIQRLFPTIAPGEELQVSAVIPGGAGTLQPLGTSNIIAFSYAAPPMQAPIIIRPTLFDHPWSVPIAFIIIFVLFNLLMIFQVGRARIRRLINNPDKHDLSDQLLAITVHRNGATQSHTLTKKTLTLGRGSSNDVNLGDDANISRQHGIIMWRKKHWYYANRKRNTKARIEGKLFKGFKLYELEPVTEIEIGETKVIFHSNAQQDISDFIRTDL
ncbi:MAG: FHA domain-containing protein [Burkholderiales bacterium]|nr:FHA domain-containing protein [Anaerolineae bacterium]